jgi:quercetin dioxygenase-like cupin family protein
MPLILRLLEDSLPARHSQRLSTALPRAIYVAAGSVMIGEEELSTDSGTVMLAAPTITAGPEGACLWRWELSHTGTAVEPIGANTITKLEAQVSETPVDDTHLLRLDSVAFPPGGCAYLHTHQGPGTRCLIEGRIRIDTEGHSTSYGPGAPWFEAGPEPVFAQADPDQSTRFIRAMVLPKDLLGQSSIRYVNAEDKDKPKAQRYRVFAERLLAG